jgi:DNA-binding MarR family transcriptional regulator
MTGDGQTPPGDLITEIMAEFVQAFGTARARMIRSAEEVHPGLTGLGLMVLQAVVRRGPITATTLTRLLSMDKSLVSRQICQLKRHGLVLATPLAEDRRVIELTATASARTVIDTGHQATAQAYRDRLAGWDQAELDQLRALLHRFNAAGPSGEGPAPSPAIVGKVASPLPACRATQPSPGSGRAEDAASP